MRRERSQTRRTPPCHTKAAAEECAVSSSHVLVCSSGVLFSPVSLATAQETRDGGDEGEKGCASLDEMPTEVTGRESDAREKFTKQLLFGSAGVAREGPGFIVLLCYCVSLNKIEGCELVSDAATRFY